MKPRDRGRASPAVKLLLCGILGIASGQPAQAGWLESLFGKSSVAADAPKAGAGQRLWRIREFSAIELVAREAGAADNQQPVQLQPEWLRQQLAQVLIGGGREPLFAADELAELATPLAQALGKAGAGDDVLLLSSSRRDGGLLAAPSAVTARLFVQGDSLQLIVHDVRLDFYDTYRGTQKLPRFVFGSRAAAASGGGAASLQSAAASSRRADWLSMPLSGAASAAAVPALMPAAALATAPATAPAALAPAPARPATGVVPAAPPPLAAAPAAATAAAPATAPVPARKPLDAAAADDIERRLETLERLRKRGLISEDEYREKRKEILQLL